MKGWKHIIMTGLFIGCVCTSGPDARGQNVQNIQAAQAAYEQEALYMEIEVRMKSYHDQLSEMLEGISSSTREEVEEMDKRMADVNVKWNTFCQIYQIDIAASDSLLQLSSDYQQVKQNLADSIALKRSYFGAESSFNEAETYLEAQDSVYAALYEEALPLSLVKKLAPVLDKLKIKEQLLFEEISSRYENMKGLAGQFPEFNFRFSALEEKFIELKEVSEKIQAMAYKPLIQRIKDYLIGLAAVAMILMFINVVQAKIKMIRQQKENLKKLGGLTGKDEDYPSI